MPANARSHQDDRVPPRQPQDAGYQLRPDDCRTPEALAKAEAKGRLPQPKTQPNGRRYYTLEDLTHIRSALGIHVGKQPDEDAVVLAVQNFKGGVGKSTITKHLADYLALHGYRVLVIDCDPQASTTTMFDIQPETLIDDRKLALYRDLGMAWSDGPRIGVTPRGMPVLDALLGELVQADLVTS